MTLPFAALGALIAALIETTVLPELPIAGAQPDLVFTLAVVATMLLSAEDGLVWAFVGGLLIDLLVPARPIGATTLSLLLVVGVAALASRAMRFVLVDHARAEVTEKRGGGARAVSFDEDQLPPADRAEDLLAIDEALTRLERHDPRLGQLVQLRFFAGLSYHEIADVVGLSVPTVKRDWARARVWLYRFMTEGSA